MNYSSIGFIGSGNMGGALARCAARSIERIGSGRILLANRTAKKAEMLANEVGGTVCSNNDIAGNCDLIFIGVKPQFTAEMLDGIAPVLASRADRFILVSMVAGLTTERICELAGGDYPVIRIMPNTACAIGEGVMQYCFRGTTEEETNAFRELMSSAGLIDEIPEKLLDAASSVSGCGPAFLCLALEGMADGGVALGLPRDKALKYAEQTFAGLGKLALETGLHPGVLKDQVTSPGGTTIQGVRALENRGVRAAFMEAVIAAFEKTAELKKNT